MNGFVFFLNIIVGVGYVGCFGFDVSFVLIVILFMGLMVCGECIVGSDCIFWWFGG